MPETLISRDPSAKFQITSSPALPAVCIACNRAAGSKAPLIDFNLSIDYYGAVLFCVDCAKELLTVIDYAPVAVLETSQSRIARLESELSRVEVENGRLRDAIDSFASIRSDIHSDIDKPNDVDSKGPSEGSGRPTLFQ